MHCAAAPADAAHTAGLRLLVTIAACNTLPCTGADVRAAVAECPPSGHIDLPSLGLGFTMGRLGPCPADPRAYCAGLGCPGDCGGDRGTCVNPTGLDGAGACVCYPGYIGAACSEVACTPAACAALGARYACSALTGRCMDPEGREVPGLTVVEPLGAAAAREVALAPGTPEARAHSAARRRARALLPE